MTSLSGRRLVLSTGIATALSALIGAAPSAIAQAALPEGPINLIVPFAPGGGTDLVFRGLAEAARPHLNRNVLVINLPGAGGAVGLTQAANKPANGLNVNVYTSEVFTLPVFNPLQFSAKDFKPILMVNEDPACLVVPADSKMNTLEAFIAEAKSRPGRVSVGNSGYGNIWHLSASAFAKKANIDLLQVPFTGAAPTLQAVMGGHIDSFVASPPEVAPQVTAGKLKILAIMADKRNPNFPDVPTLREKGIDLSMGTWRALSAPAGTPDNVVRTLQDVFAAAAREKSFVDFMNGRGLTIRYMPTAELNAFIAAQRPAFEALAADVKKTPQQ